MRIRVNLRNKFYYIGEVVSEDEFFITLIDKNGKTVSINKQDIITKEVFGND